MYDYDVYQYVVEWTAAPKETPYEVQAIYEDIYGPILRSDTQTFQVIENKSEILTQSEPVINGPYIPLMFNDYNKETLNVYVQYDDASAPYVPTAVTAIKHWSRVLQERSGNPDAWKFNIFTSRNFPNAQTNVNILVNLKLENKWECPGWSGGCAHNDWLRRLWNGHLVIYVYTGSGSQGFISYITSHEFGHALGLGHAWNEGNQIDRTADMMCSLDYRSTFLGEIAIGPLVKTCETPTDVYHDDGQPSEFDVRAVLYAYENDGFQSPNVKLYGNDIYVCQLLPCELPHSNVSPKEQSPPSVKVIKPTNPNPKQDTHKIQQIKKKTTTTTTTRIESKTNNPKPHVLSDLSNYGLATVGSFGKGPGQLNHPASVAIDPNGQRVYVSDLDNNRIQVLHRDGNFIAEWGTLGFGKGQFNSPGAIAVDDDHKLVFVSDIKNNRIEKFDTQGKYLEQWGTLGKGDGQFDHPGDLALDPDKEILYVTDIYNNRVQAFYYDGNFITKWGSFGTGNGQFNRPAGISINLKDNLIYVSDTVNNRIQVFDSDGRYVKEWGSLGSGNGQFARPDGLFYESSEKAIYVADRQNHRIQVFDDKGAYVTKWLVTNGPSGKEVKPRDIVVDPSGLIYVVNQENSNVLVYKPSNDGASTELIGQSQSGKPTVAKTETYKLWLIAYNVNVDSGTVNLCVWSSSIVAPGCKQIDLSSLFIQKKTNYFIAGYVPLTLNEKPRDMYMCAETLKLKGPQHWFSGCNPMTVDNKGFLVGKIDFKALHQKIAK